MHDPKTLALRGAVLSRKEALLHRAALAIGASLLVAASAQIAFRVPFSPVPVTAQTLAVLLVGALLGSRLGTAAILLYLMEGAAGLPFFAQGAGGVAFLAGPTGGYLFAFVPAAFLVGALAERGWDRRPLAAAAAMALGSAVILLGGASFLARLIGPERAIDAGILPFLPGDLLKTALAALAVSAARRGSARARK
ncbi:MAG: biotin transporter BioY [Candidatus Eisenbacteria bacterium]|nr:biotin transporter BioY [Candidatus Eisenbacteria bacterium]